MSSFDNATMNQSHLLLSRAPTEDFAMGGRVLRASRLYGNVPVGAKMADSVLSAYPAGSYSNDVKFSRDGQFLAVAHESSPYFSVYRYNGETFTKLSNPSTLPTGTVTAVSWAPDDSHLAVTHLNSPYLSLYTFNGSSLVKVPDPSVLPSGDATDLAWSPSGNTLAVSHETTPFITSYKVFGSTLTKLSDPGVIPAGDSYGVAWSPNGLYLMVSPNGSPHRAMYRFNGNDTFTLLTGAFSAFDVWGAITRRCAWSPCGRFIAVPSTSGTELRVYPWFDTGNVFETVIISDDPPDDCYGVSWSPDGRILVVTHDSSPYFTMYSFDGIKLTKMNAPSELPGGDARQSAWSPDGKILAISHTVAPCLSLYKMLPGANSPGALLTIENPSCAI